MRFLPLEYEQDYSTVQLIDRAGVHQESNNQRNIGTSAFRKFRCRDNRFKAFEMEMKVVQSGIRSIWMVSTGATVRASRYSHPLVRV